MKRFTESLDRDKFSEVTDELSDMIQKTVDSSGGEFKEFIDLFLKDPNDVKIEGLIDESDIYEFYLKYRNQIDECLNDIKFYTNIPSEMNVFGLYDYMIIGTIKAVEEFVRKI